MLSVLHKAERPVKIVTLLACLLLTVCLIVKPVEQTTAFITAESATCVNTFSGEEAVTPPDITPEPGDGEPTTGDTSNPGAWLVLAGVSAGLCVLRFAALKLKKTKKY